MIFIPIVHFLNNHNQTTSGMKQLLDYVSQVKKTVLEDKRFVSTINCSAVTCLNEMQATKNMYHKNSGRIFYHLVQSFPSGDETKPELAHKIACEFAQKAFGRYECVVATHIDIEHIHSHFVFNSVSFEDGKKYHSDKNTVQELMTFNRKGLGKLDIAVDEEKLDAVLVKDLSRLGRHRTQTELYIDHLRQNNVKVISVTEGIDSSNENDDLMIGFKQIFNDFYAKDISKKVKAGVRQKQKNNGLIETLPMEYFLDRNTNEVQIDKEAAEIVRKVFELYVEGYGTSTIAKKMNELGIRSPEYFQRRRLANWKPEISKKYLWVQTAVKRILSNELYIGTMVNHKTVVSKIYKTKSVVPDEERFRHENFCEPIIDETVWKQAQLPEK